GIVKFGSVSSIGSATIAVFDLNTAQQLFNKQGKFDVVRVAAKGNTPSSKLAAQIRPLLPSTAQVRTVSAQVKQETKNVGFVGIIQKILLGFGGVALFVGAFVIFNTISITVAQRMRELATLRTIGASRRQVMASVLGEALIVGALAALAGLFLGFGLAVGLDKLMASTGIDLPKSATVFATRTAVVSLIVGIVITLLSALRPALRATRVPPIAAVREGADLPPGRLAFLGPPLKAIVAAAGIALLLYGFFVHGISVTQRLVAMGAGALLLFVGVALISAWLVPPLASVLGWPATKIGGSAGDLARANSIRNPGRTASTAAALMIGIALVTSVAALASGIRNTVHNTLERTYAKHRHVGIGDHFSLQTPAGTKLDLVLKGTYVAPKGPPAFGSVIIPQRTFDRVYPQPTNIFQFVNIRGGATDANTKKLKAALADFPDVKLQTESQFRSNQAKFINQLLALLYVLLALSVIISLFGIVNTLVLTVFERTRE